MKKDSSISKSNSRIRNVSPSSRLCHVDMKAIYSRCNLNRVVKHQKTSGDDPMVGVRLQNPEDNNSMFLGLCVRKEEDLSDLNLVTKYLSMFQSNFKST